MDSLTIHPAELGQIDAIVGFWIDHAEGTDRHDTSAGIKQLIARDPDALLVAEIGNELAATLIVGWDGWRLHLYRLAVRTDLRRQGIGRALVHAAESRATETGASRVDAMVLDDNALGQSIWAGLGYQRQDQWSRWVRVLEPG